VVLNTSKYFITGSENTPRLAIVLLLSSKREHVKLNWVSTFLGKDQLEMLNKKNKAIIDTALSFVKKY
jgi:hypothetical protein